MKLLSALVVLLLTSTSFAKEIQSSDVAISPAHIEKVYQLVNKKDPGSSQLKINVVVVDTGMSTDVSPRYQVYLGLGSIAEMGNMSADFKITDQALTVDSGRRISSGVFEIKTSELRFSEVNGNYSEEYLDVAYTVDARPALQAKEAKRKACGGDFCDGVFSAHILLTEKTSSVK